MPDVPAAALDVRGLVVRYGARAAVDAVDLAAPAAGITAVLGPNGAGKTSTLEVCEGLRRADAGQVRVLGLDPVRHAAELHARVGVMLQGDAAGTGVGGTVSARQALRHAAAMYAHPHDPERLLGDLDLLGVAATPTRRLSGGERQRVALALALVGRPELVFLDEPTVGLDPHARRQVWDLLAALRSDGVTVAMTTHLMDEAERLADHVVMLSGGRVVATGSPAELTGAGAEDGLRFAGPPGLPLDTLRTALPDGCTVREPSLGSYRLDGLVDPQVLATVTAWCAGHGVMPQGLTVGRRSLEDVFLDLTGRDQPLPQDPR